MIDLIILVILGLVIGGAAGYVYKAKKAGQKCIGCPHSATCGAGKGEGFCDCASHGIE